MSCRISSSISCRIFLKSHARFYTKHPARFLSEIFTSCKDLQELKILQTMLYKSLARHLARSFQKVAKILCKVQDSSEEGLDLYCARSYVRNLQRLCRDIYIVYNATLACAYMVYVYVFHTEVLPRGNRVALCCSSADCSVSPMLCERWSSLFCC